MTNIDDRGWNAEEKKSIRKAAFQLAELQSELEKAKAIAEKIPWKFEEVDFARELQRQIDQIEGIFQRSMFRRALTEMPAGEQIRQILSKDAFLRFSVIISASFSIVLAGFASNLIFDKFLGLDANSSYFLNRIKALFDRLFSELLLTNDAYAQASATASTANSLRDWVQVIILLVIPTGFIASFLVLMKSDQEDSRKLASDTIKTITGFAIGVATNFFK